MGKEINGLWRKRPKTPSLLFIWGVVLVIMVIIPPVGISLSFRFLPTTLTIFLSIPLFKSAFSIKGLFGAGREIQKALESDNLERARELTSWHLVSRDTSKLTREEITGCIIESLSENLTDSIISPLFWYILLGIPGAWFSRAVNTCDAMIGYRGGDYEWGGKFAARLDDVVQWIPSRLAALLICISAPLCGISFGKTWTVMLRERNKTDSPNAGWTMSVAAGALDIELRKNGYYILNKGARESQMTDLEPFFRLLRMATILGITLFLGILGVITWATLL